MDKKSHAQSSIEWNYLCIPKHQRLHRCSFGIDKLFHSSYYNGCNNVSMLIGSNNTLWPDGRIRLFAHHNTPYHHYADLSESIELLKCFPGTLCLEWVSKIKSVLSVILQAIHGALRIQLTHFTYDDCDYACTLFCHHHQIGRMTHLLLFRVRLWNNGMRCMSFLCLWYWLQHSWLSVLHEAGIGLPEIVKGNVCFEFNWVWKL